MGAYTDVVEMLQPQRKAEARCILEYDRWKVYELALDLEKLKWLWDEMQKYRTLFSDFTRGSPENFYEVVKLEDSLWLDIREGDKTIGIGYWTNLANVIDPEVHLMFFDRKPAEKVALCKEVLRWFFKEFPGAVRMTATLPEIYHATIRLAKRIGFRFEGKKRRSQLMGGRYVDEVILGLLVEEL
jgi:hypothetical protein